MKRVQELTQDPRPAKRANQATQQPGASGILLSNHETRLRILERAEQKVQRSREDVNSVHERKLSAPIPLSTSTRTTLPVKDQLETVQALNDIATTPFVNSFASRIQGAKTAVTPGLAPNQALYVDWDAVTHWMKLMTDVRDHYVLSRAASGEETELATEEAAAPITYTTLQRSHLPQVHDLLERVFWSGIDVSDSMDYSPERATVIAVYKKLVVGVAILSSPQETYITFLAVRAGWDKARIAKTILYLLISRNPNKDITLHVSVNNSAMLLYNQFGFKAEEFVAGFYDDYLDPLSRASKNAFKLRLRQ